MHILYRLYKVYRKYKKRVISSGSVAIARKHVEDMHSSLVLKPQVGTLAVAGDFDGCFGKLVKFVNLVKVFTGTLQTLQGLQEIQNLVIASDSVAIARKRVDDMHSPLVLQPQVGTLAGAGKYDKIYY